MSKNKVHADPYPEPTKEREEQLIEQRDKFDRYIKFAENETKDLYFDRNRGGEEVEGKFGKRTRYYVTDPNEGVEYIFDAPKSVSSVVSLEMPRGNTFFSITKSKDGAGTTKYRTEVKNRNDIQR